jgi:hypothetical protein
MRTLQSKIHGTPAVKAITHTYNMYIAGNAAGNKELISLINSDNTITWQLDYIIHCYNFGFKAGSSKSKLLEFWTEIENGIKKDVEIKLL